MIAQGASMRLVFVPLTLIATVALAQPSGEQLIALRASIVSSVARIAEIDARMRALSPEQGQEAARFVRLEANGVEDLRFRRDGLQQGCARSEQRCACTPRTAEVRLHHRMPLTLALSAA
jgi:hypothetical protein